MLLTSIPYFREVIVMSFRCEHCGASNNEIMSAGTIRRMSLQVSTTLYLILNVYLAEGTVYTARILARSDLNRQIVRSPTCEIVIPEYELTLPASARGQLTTIEGLIRDVIADLSMDQPLRRIQDEEGYTKLQALIDNLKQILADDEDEDGEAQLGTASMKEHIPMPAFTVKLDDPAGNSFIEFLDSMADPKWNLRTYARSLQQNIALGLVAPEEDQSTTGDLAPVTEVDEGIGGGEPETDEEIFVFHGPCSSCGHPLDTLMKKVVIPYFKVSLSISTSLSTLVYSRNLGYYHHVN